MSILMSIRMQHAMRRFFRQRQSTAAPLASRGAGGRPFRAVFGLSLALLLATPGMGTEADDADVEEDSTAVRNDRGRSGSRSERRQQFGGFSPYFSSGPYTTIQRVKGRVATTYGPQDAPRNTLTNLGWLFELGVESPAFERLPGKPRLHAFGGVMIPTNESSVIGSRVVFTTMNDDRLTEDTKMALEYQTSYRAGLGSEFEIEVLSTRIKLMPGVQYLYLGSRYTAEAESTLVLPTGNVERRSSAKNALAQHFLGPSLKITTDHVRMGPFLFDVYIEGSLLFDIAGTREQSRFVDGDGEISTFTWEADTTSGVFNAGLRIRLP